jgi:hypothetical protein
VAKNNMRRRWPIPSEMAILLMPLLAPFPLRLEDQRDVVMSSSVTHCATFAG